MSERPRHSMATLLDEARAEFRDQKGLDAMAMARIAELPEDDFGHFARESFQDGMGYAYLMFAGLPDIDSSAHDYQTVVELSDNPVDAFFLTRPTHDSLKEYQEWCKAEFMKRLRQPSEIELVNPFGYTVDEYEFEAFLAFLEGYKLVTVNPQ